MVAVTVDSLLRVSVSYRQASVVVDNAHIYDIHQMLITELQELVQVSPEAFFF